MIDKREEFIEKLNHETLLTYENSERIVNDIPDKYINKAIDIYNKLGIYGFEIFMKGLNILKQSESIKSEDE